VTVNDGASSLRYLPSADSDDDDDLPKLDMSAMPE
jgi:hypothetical protein